MCRNVSKDGGQGSNTEWGMVQIVNAHLLLRGQAKLTASFAGDGIAELVECLGQVAARKITGSLSPR